MISVCPYPDAEHRKARLPSLPAVTNARSGSQQSSMASKSRLLRLNRIKTKPSSNSHAHTAADAWKATHQDKQIGTCQFTSRATQR